jgi:hypothetical protein
VATGARQVGNLTNRKQMTSFVNDWIILGEGTWCGDRWMGKWALHEMYRSEYFDCEGGDRQVFPLTKRSVKQTHGQDLRAP